MLRVGVTGYIELPLRFVRTLWLLWDMNGMFGVWSCLLYEFVFNSYCGNTLVSLLFSLVLSMVYRIFSTLRSLYIRAEEVCKVRLFSVFMLNVILFGKIAETVTDIQVNIHICIAIYIMHETTLSRDRSDNLCILLYPVTQKIWIRLFVAC